MNERRFFNPHLPQTLLIATVLLYINAAFSILSGIAAPLLLLLGIGLAAGGYGIANEQKWGYGLAVAAAILNFALLYAAYGLDGILGPYILSALFDGALIALLVHPMSRDYQRIWFR